MHSGNTCEGRRAVKFSLQAPACRLLARIFNISACQVGRDRRPKSIFVLCWWRRMASSVDVPRAERRVDVSLVVTLRCRRLFTILSILGRSLIVLIVVTSQQTYCSTPPALCPCSMHHRAGPPIHQEQVSAVPRSPSCHVHPNRSS